MDEILSEHGVERRQQILLLAKVEARHRRTRRSMGRGAVALLVVAAASVAIFRREKQPGLPIVNPLPIATISTAVSPPKLVIEYVQTDPTITDRLSIPPEPPRWTSIDDAELLQDLASAGQPSGIVCMNGKTILLPR